MGFFKNLFSRKEKKKNAEKYVAGLDKSSAVFSSKLNALSAKFRKVDEDYFESLEEILIEADVGVNLALQIVEASEGTINIESKQNEGTSVTVTLPCKTV